MEEGDEAIECTLLNKRDAKVYRIPPAASAAGHRAGDWQESIWRGTCRVVRKGKDMTIRLVHANTGELFAQCLIPNGEYEKYVEKVLDSSRYFVLRIANAQRHAFIGFGFSERGDAFDFNCCLADFKSTFVDRDRECAEAKDTPALQDLSLKEGEKITIRLKGIEAASTRRRGSGAEGGGLGAARLAPPPPPPPSGKLAPPPPPPSSQPVRHHAPSSRHPPSAAAGPAAEPAAQEDFADFESIAVVQQDELADAQCTRTSL